MADDENSCHEGENVGEVATEELENVVDAIEQRLSIVEDNSSSPGFGSGEPEVSDSPVGFSGDGRDDEEEGTIKQEFSTVEDNSSAKFGSGEPVVCDSPVGFSGDGRDADDEDSSSTGDCSDSEGDDNVVIEKNGDQDNDVEDDKDDETKEVEKEVDDSQKNTNALIYCDVCTIYCKGERAYQIHVTGIFHAKQAAKQQEELLAGGQGNEEKEDAEEDGTKFSCKLCSKTFKEVDVLKGHYRSLAHRKSLEAALSTSGTVIEDISANLDLEDHKEEALLGLELVTEIYSFNRSRVIQYCCDVCDCGSLRANDLFPHVKGLRHQVNYMAKHFPDWAKVIANEKSTTIQKELATKYAEEIVASKGQGKIIKVKLDDSGKDGTLEKKVTKDTSQGLNKDKKPRGKMYSDLLGKDAAAARARRQDRTSQKPGGGKTNSSGKGNQRGGRLEPGARNRGQNRPHGGDIRPLMSIPVPGRDYGGPMPGMGRGMSQGFNRGQMQQGRGRGLLMQQMGHQSMMNPNWNMQQGMMGNQMVNQQMGMRDLRMPARDIRYDHGFCDWSRDDFTIGSQYQNNNVMFNNDCYPSDLWEGRGRGKRPNMPNNPGPGGDNLGYGGYPLKKNEPWKKNGQDDRGKGNKRYESLFGGKQGQATPGDKKQYEETNAKKKLMTMIGNMSESDASFVLKVAGAVSKQ